MIDFDFRSKFVGTNFRPELIIGQIAMVVDVFHGFVWDQGEVEIISVQAEQILIFQLGGARTPGPELSTA